MSALRRRVQTLKERATSSGTLRSITCLPAQRLLAGNRVNQGDHPDPTVTYRLGSATAEGIASGELDPYEEFMAGRLEISGESSTLVDNQHLLESLQVAIAGV